MTPALRKQIVDCYDSRWIRGYTGSKLRWDPVYDAALEVLRGSSLPLLDVGCGIGILALYLRMNGFTAPITGVDRDGEKIGIARRATMRFDGIDFLHASGDALPELGGNVALLDVLQYVRDDDQQRLLRSVRDHVAPGGVLVLRQTIRDKSWRYKMTVAEESFAVAIKWLKSEVLNFPTLDEVVAPFREAGFDVQVRPLWGRMPYNNFFFVFRAPASQRDSSGMTNE